MFSEGDEEDEERLNVSEPFGDSKCIKAEDPAHCDSQDK